MATSQGHRTAPKGNRKEEEEPVPRKAPAKPDQEDGTAPPVIDHQQPQASANLLAVLALLQQGGDNAAATQTGAEDPSTTGAPGDSADGVKAGAEVAPAVTEAADQVKGLRAAAAVNQQLTVQQTCNVDDTAADAGQAAPVVRNESEPSSEVRSPKSDVGLCTSPPDVAPDVVSDSPRTDAGRRRSEFGLRIQADDPSPSGNQSAEPSLTSGAKLAAYMRTEDVPRLEQPSGTSSAPMTQGLIAGLPETQSAARPASAAAAHPVTATEPKTPSSEAGVTQQIVKSVSLMWREGIGEARLRLEPEHLGTITVSLKVERGSVDAVMTADQPAVRGWVAAHERELRASLSENGLELDRLIVREESDRNSADQRGEQGSDRQRRQRRRETEARFELSA